MSERCPRVESLHDWQKHIVRLLDSISSATEILDKFEPSFVIATADDGKFKGLLTDSRLRKAFLKGVSANHSIEQALRLTQEHVGDDRPQILETNSLDGISVGTNIDGRPIRVEIVHEEFGLIHNSPVVLMVGGIGNRLRPLTDNCPKPMLRVGGKPLLLRTLESLIKQGFTRFFLSVNYKAEQIEEFFGDGSNWGVKIDYLRELSRMGTAGSLRMLPEHQCNPIVVMNGDLFSETNLPITKLLSFHKRQAATATMAVAPHAVTIPFGVVETNGDLLIQIREKPVQTSFINAGMYVIEPDVLTLLPSEGPCDMPTVFEKVMARNEKTCAFALREEWIDIGSFETFEQVCNRFKLEQKETLGSSQSQIERFSRPILH